MMNSAIVQARQRQHCHYCKIAESDCKVHLLSKEHIRDYKVTEPWRLGFVTFVILGQRSAFDNLKTAALKDSISQQTEILKEGVEIIVPHVDFPDIVGFWALWPLFSSLAVAMNSSAVKATDTFAIDAKHEEITCTDEPLIKPQDIFVGVKTFSEYHTTRIPVIKRTWSAHLPFIEYFSDLVNNVIPTVDSGVPNTERGHCGKTFVILKRFVDLLDADVSSQKFSWLLISDDDTLISIPRLLRLLSCYDSNEKIIIGERYGYGFSSFGATGYDYPTGGAGMVFSPSAARTIVSKCACPADDAPDDMIIGMCSQRNDVAIIHNPAFHQARPIDYPDQYIRSEEAYESSGTMDDSSDDSLHIDDELQDSTLSVPTSSGAVDSTDTDGKLHRPLQILWSKLRKLGCVVDAAQVKPTRRKLKCYVDRCVYKGGPFDSLQLRCTLPPKVELAIQWICICVVSSSL
ncbi:hypothetical protein TELCIR_03079 [Teladorsagia circumcincta]|uniref:Fringe-like glycosyltransferase domain-containing protein n=1 Tax=Teladorsagia circumcincta TaxID=45464 RepID=A0A2G9UZG5_TELCI|nr:hypothetical protein TELCIR_03079 [Teladorsagia circumcincta]